MTSIFEKRVAFKPFEYPEVTKFKDAINHSYWLVSEFNFTSDIQDFHTQLTDIERSAIKNAMLAISQIEVSVKKFWAKLGDRFPKAEFDQVGITFGESECFDDQTEILTASGWKFFENLDANDLVAQYDEGTISFTNYSNPIKKQYQGIMHHYFGAGTDLMVTPNHEILVCHPTHSKFVKRKSSDGIWSRNYRYPCAGTLISPNPIVFTDLDRLLIALQADGCLFANCPSTTSNRRDFVVTLSKDRKINRFLSICQRLNINLKHRTNDAGQSVFNGRLPDNAPDPKLIKGFKYIDFSKIDSVFATEFLLELKHWDSHSRKDSNSFIYYNSNEDAVDVIQFMAASCGKSSNKGINRKDIDSIKLLSQVGKIRKSSKTVYALYVTDLDKKVYSNRNEINYSGYVYCVSVPSGCIVTRRNKRVAIVGNCRHSDAYAHLLEILGLNDEFNQLLNNQVIQGRIDYLSKYLRGAADNSHENYTLTLALFSIFIENVSLFSQFLIIKSFYKQKNLLKDIDNVISATMREETLHALFGIYVINLIRREHPDWFDDDFYAKLHRACLKAFEAESKILDWMYEKGELPFLPKVVVLEFIKDRFNQSLLAVDAQPVFETDKSLLQQVRWFDDEIHAENVVDFFHQKSTNYHKFSKSITANDLF
jgi:ribonucleotide reductase beta subunit family protein with ferritin-like domain